MIDEKREEEIYKYAAKMRMADVYDDLGIAEKEQVHKARRNMTNNDFRNYLKGFLDAAEFNYDNIEIVLDDGDDELLGDYMS